MTCDQLDTNMVDRQKIEGNSRATEIKLEPVSNWKPVLSGECNHIIPLYK